MTKADLINEIAISTGFDKKTIGSVVEAFMKDIKKTMAGGENVYLRGFGSFIIKRRAAKVARNITSQATISVPEHSVLSFKAAKEFADEIRPVKAKPKAAAKAKTKKKK